MRVAGIEPTLWQIMSLLHSDQIAKPAQQLVSLTLVPLVPAISACRTQLGINPSALPGLFRPAFHVREGGGGGGMVVGAKLNPQTKSHCVVSLHL